MKLLPLLAAGLLATASARSEDIFKIDFSSGSPGSDVVTSENALPDPYPGKEVTFVVKAPHASFKLAAPGALPTQHAVLTDSGPTNGAFLLRWAEDSEDKVVSSGTLTVKWTMNFVSGADGDVTFQILRADLEKEAGRQARININSQGSVKIGGSTKEGAADDSRLMKNLATGAPHNFVWTLNYGTGVQTLQIDGGSALNFSSASRPELNFFPAPALALKVEVRGNDAVIAFDDFIISHD